MAIGRCQCGTFEDIRVRIGGFEGDLDVGITAHVWVGSKATWYEIEDSIPRYPEAISSPRDSETLG